MPRNRMIKPEFCISKSLSSVSRDARLTFINMWSFCDDYGFILNSMRSILGDVYPVDETVTEKLLRKWIDELLSINVLVELEYKGKDLLYVRSWEEHQTVPNKSKRVHVDDVDREQLISTILDSNETFISPELDSSDTKSKEQRERIKEKAQRIENSFKDFWKLYPKHTNRKEALDYWKKKIDELDITPILAAVQTYPFSEDPQYIPQAVNWLKKERWKDEPQSTQPQTAAQLTSEEAVQKRYEANIRQDKLDKGEIV